MRRDAVNDFLVDAGAGGGRKRGPARVLVRIVFEQAARRRNAESARR